VTADVQRLEPPSSEAAQPFWDATRERRLVLQWCTSCDRPVHYPRHLCPSCLGDALTWHEASGRATVYAVTVEHRPQQPGLAAMAPLAVALVDLEEGVRLLTNVVGTAPEDVAVGMAVRVTWEPLDDGRHLPLFAPAG
jgi:uncharacterized OB-fold protein